MAVLSTEDEYKRLIQAAKGGATNLPLATGAATATPLGVSTGTPTVTPLSAPTTLLSKAPAVATPAITTTAQTPQTSGYSAMQVPTSTSQEGYLNDIYSAQNDANVIALQNAYQQNVGATNAAAAKIPQQYTDARNLTAGTAEQNRQAFNEYAAASGLNSGTGGQAQLAMNSTLQGNLNSLNQAEANALAEIETQRLQLQTEYQSAIAQAIAENGMAKAQALYSEMVRLDDSMVSTALNQADENYRAWSANQAISEQQRAALEAQAENLAAYGDFSGYSKLGYTADQLSQMQNVWAAANPTLASALGISTGGSGGGSGGGYDVTLTDFEESIYQAAKRIETSGKGAQTIGNYIEQRVDNGKIRDVAASAMTALFGIDKDEAGNYSYIN